MTVKQWKQHNTACDKCQLPLTETAACVEKTVATTLDAMHWYTAASDDFTFDSVRTLVTAIRSSPSSPCCVAVVVSLRILLNTYNNNHTASRLPHTHNYHEGEADPSGFRVWWNSSSLRDIFVPLYRQCLTGSSKQQQQQRTLKTLTQSIFITRTTVTSFNLSRVILQDKSFPELFYDGEVNLQDL